MACREGHLRSLTKIGNNLFSSRGLLMTSLIPLHRTSHVPLEHHKSAWKAVPVLFSWTACSISSLHFALYKILAMTFTPPRSSIIHKSSAPLHSTILSSFLPLLCGAASQNTCVMLPLLCPSNPFLKPHLFCEASETTICLSPHALL